MSDRLATFLTAGLIFLQCYLIARALLQARNEEHGLIHLPEA